MSVRSGNRDSMLTLIIIVLAVIGLIALVGAFMRRSRV
jgi:flagellar basal body-associated protein FliL